MAKGHVIVEQTWVFRGWDVIVCSNRAGRYLSIIAEWEFEVIFVIEFPFELSSLLDISKFQICYLVQWVCI